MVVKLNGATGIMACESRQKRIAPSISPRPAAINYDGAVVDLVLQMNELEWVTNVHVVFRGARKKDVSNGYSIE